MINGYFALITTACLAAFISCNEVAIEARDGWLVEAPSVDVPPPIPTYCEENPDDSSCNIIGVGHVATIFKQVQTGAKVDILWIIDNSGSMEDEQESLAQNFNSFIEQFVNSEADFRIAITTTDTICSTTQRLGSTKDMGACGEFNINKANPLPLAPIIDSAMSIEEIKEHFAYNVQVGITGSYDEAGLKGALMALENTNNPNSNNFNFLRDDAYLAIIIVSDENDISSDDDILPEDEADINIRSVESYIDAYRSFKPNNPNDLAIYSIVNTSSSDSYVHDQASYSGGSRYMKASELTDGFSSSISSNFADSLLVIGNSIAEKTNRFYIPDVPNAGTIKIYLNDVEIPNDTQNGWYYDDTTGSILFNGRYVPDDDDVMEIAYTKYIYSD